jgi:hypothetical protein
MTLTLSTEKRCPNPGEGTNSSIDEGGKKLKIEKK